jgi:hypothetical protein
MGEERTLTTPLKYGAIVTLLHEPPSPVTGKRPNHEIGYVGQAGFMPKGGGLIYWWHERGQTWASETLDRIDETKTRFSQAAKCGGKNP